MRTSALAFVAGSTIAAAAIAAGPQLPGMPATPRASDANYVKSGNFADGGVVFSDNFDAYAVGGGIIGQNNWIGWDLVGLDHVVSNAQSTSAPNSLHYGIDEADVVQDFFNQGAVIDAGVVTVSVMTYIPNNAIGESAVIMLNTYDGNTATHVWSMQTPFAALLGLVGGGFAGGTYNQHELDLQQPIMYDAWVEYKVVIDLDNNTLVDTYGGLSLGTRNDGSPSWWVGAGNPMATAQAVPKIECLDMYMTSGVGAGSAVTGGYFDDLSITVDGGGCYADCDGSGALNIFDYICFGNEYAAGNAYADCDGSGSLNIFDYICFGNEYAAGCP
ncbi:MAG: hypothetical protein H6815_04530 [Phycisphaeraceae bacterium]|nr:hypothetical protein [Phycisphaerales bacterium]MCB9859699.1 hypothetical protein [Phycisphaeraceae bacterium]